jgi:hypothetical protein
MIEYILSLEDVHFLDELLPIVIRPQPCDSISISPHHRAGRLLTLAELALVLKSRTFCGAANYMMLDVSSARHGSEGVWPSIDEAPTGAGGIRLQKRDRFVRALISRLRRRRTVCWTRPRSAGFRSVVCEKRIGSNISSSPLKQRVWPLCGVAIACLVPRSPNAKPRPASQGSF